MGPDALRVRLSRVTEALRPPSTAPRVRRAVDLAPTEVDRYWGEHTVNSRPFRSAHESTAYLEWRFRQYPLFPEFMELWGDHAGERLLDYGCGPGDDLTGFLLFSGARHVIGIDVSAKALALASRRLALHRIEPGRVELLQSADASTAIPLPDASIDFVNCGGVLHHASDPEALLREFHRVLVPGGRANVMVYNRESVFFHLYVAYARMVLEGAFSESTVDEAFRRSTDGADCPISCAFLPVAFSELCRGAGFDSEFVGGYLSHWDLECARLAGAAARDERLGEEHRAFAARLEQDARGLPRHGGLYAGIGGVFRLQRC